jgi:hypothetical protein
MSDIFISYAHEDQPFVRAMVPALEAEGFSVWWDHTIPPGKSWDTFIAKGIEEARCCIVIWSPHSVASDWVKEEATLAKAKLLPVQMGVSEPPVGFRRIQAANLQNWNGDRANPQWQLLVQEARNLISTAGPASSGVQPRPAYQPPPAPRRTSRVLLGLGAAALVAVAAFVWFANRPPAQYAEEAPPAVSQTQDAATTTPPEPAVETPAAVDASAAEIERLRRERDESAAAQRAAEQRANEEREARIQEQRRNEAAQRTADLVVGVWTGAIAWGNGDNRETVWTMEADGTMSNRHGERGRWTLTGRRLYVTVRSNQDYDLTYDGTINSAGVYSGNAHADMSGGIEGTFRFTR